MRNKKEAVEGKNTPTYDYFARMSRPLLSSQQRKHVQVIKIILVVFFIPINTVKYVIRIAIRNICFQTFETVFLWYHDGKKYAK